jgi:hypothetical protein
MHGETSTAEALARVTGLVRPWARVLNVGVERCRVGSVACGGVFGGVFGGVCCKPTQAVRSCD